MAGRKVFTSGEILTAADVNSFLMDQSVMVFADSTARSSAIPTPSEGMVTYLEDTDEVTVFNGSVFKAVGPGKILQVVSTTKTDTFTTTSTTFTDITGLTVTITPTSATSQILVACNMVVGSPSNNTAFLGLVRNSTDIARSTTATGVDATFFLGDMPTTSARGASFTFLDSPATTSATTYKVQMRVHTASTSHVNRRGDDNFFGAISTITVMEVAG